jgi:hypothetical protein
MELTRRLFVPQERWGWEYVDPGGPGEPDASRKPLWDEPPPPDTAELEARRKAVLAKLPRRLEIAAFLVVFGLVADALWFSGAAFLIFIAVPLAASSLIPAWTTKQELEKIRKAAAEHRADQWRQYQAALAAWQAEAQAEEAADAERRAGAKLFFPLGPASEPARVDVVGGTGDGWASLLATMGPSVLTHGTGILLVDLSERGVGGGLAVLANAAGCPVEMQELPEDLATFGLLEGLPGDAVAELLADAFDSVRSAGSDPTLRALDADLLAAVSRSLDGPMTFDRLASGLHIMSGSSDQRSTSRLSEAEASRIRARMGAVGGPKVMDELHYLRTSLEMLAELPASAPAPSPGATGGHDRPWWPVRGLRVIATSSRGTSARRKDLTDRVLFQMILHQLRQRRDHGSSDMVVVAGADHLGHAALEEFARHADIAGVRLVYMFERLADDGGRILGSQGSATVVMRLGSAAQAAAAAEFVGRGHSFVLSRVTAEVGRSFTTGEAVSRGRTESTAETKGTSGSGRFGAGGVFGRLAGGGDRSWHRSVTVARSTTWQRTQSIAESDSASHGAALQRVYEFTVEPTAIQTLPPTAFLLVDSATGTRRAVLADCNPGIVLLPRVSDEPSSLSSPSSPYSQGADALPRAPSAAGITGRRDATATPLPPGAEVRWPAPGYQHVQQEGHDDQPGGSTR